MYDTLRQPKSSAGRGHRPRSLFELAFDTVKRAERTLGHDKGNPTYLQYDYYLAGK